jgi:hypothetical protein
VEDVKTATGCPQAMPAAGCLASVATIMHGMKIDVKRKIYLVSIEKIDSTKENDRDSAFCCRLLSALQKISSVIPLPR